MEPPKRQILYDKKAAQATMPKAATDPKPKVNTPTENPTKPLAKGDPSVSIASWIKEHPLFKWSAMCLKISLDKGNFHKWINSEKPVIPDKYIQKIIPILKQYGYAE